MKRLGLGISSLVTKVIMSIYVDATLLVVLRPIQTGRDLATRREFSVFSFQALFRGEGGRS
jgi:hypothetical protein